MHCSFGHRTARFVCFVNWATCILKCSALPQGDSSRACIITPRWNVQTLWKVAQIAGLRLKMNEGPVLLGQGNGGTVCWCCCSGLLQYNGYFVCLCATGSSRESRYSSTAVPPDSCARSLVVSQRDHASFTCAPWALLTVLAHLSKTLHLKLSFLNSFESKITETCSELSLFRSFFSAILKYFYLSISIFCYLILTGKYCTTPLHVSYHKLYNVVIHFYSTLQNIK